MLERLGDKVKSRLKALTMKMAGDDAEHRLAAVARPENEFGVDPFGFSLDYTLSALAPFVWLYKHYHRVQVHGIERVPPGRVLLVANHSGQIPMDGAMIGVAMSIISNHPSTRWRLQKPSRVAIGRGSGSFGSGERS